MAKVILINGSPKAKGNTFIALSEVQKTLEEIRCAKTGRVDTYTFHQITITHNKFKQL